MTRLPRQLSAVGFLAAFFALLASVSLAQAQAPPASPSAGPPEQQTPSSAAAPQHDFHSVTVKFDYDFSRTPACTRKIQKGCTARFVVYDISAGFARRWKLFTIPVPDRSKGQVQGISGTSPMLDFEPGRHHLAVTAQEPSGVESRVYAATVWVDVP